MKSEVLIINKEMFSPVHTFECGQFFRYQKQDDGSYFVVSKNHRAKVEKCGEDYKVFCDDKAYFSNFLDLETDYEVLKKKLFRFEFLRSAAEFGKGIRILRQPLFEMIVSFVISQNNNIKRIQKIVESLCEKCGEKVKDAFGDYFAFPCRDELLKLTENDFVTLGFGYRAKYMLSLLPKLDDEFLKKLEKQPTQEARKMLISLPGIGPKVADCILLFGMHRGDVFPVDVWAHRAFFAFFPKVAEQNKKLANSREAVAAFMVEQFGELSGLAQQYMFYKMRESGY